MVPKVGYLWEFWVNSELVAVPVFWDWDIFIFFYVVLPVMDNNVHISSLPPVFISRIKTLHSICINYTCNFKQNVARVDVILVSLRKCHETAALVKEFNFVLVELIVSI